MYCSIHSSKAVGVSNSNGSIVTGYEKTKTTKAITIPAPTPIPIFNVLFRIVLPKKPSLKVILKIS